jgi:hypothetical protein
MVDLKDRKGTKLPFSERELIHDLSPGGWSVLLHTNPAPADIPDSRGALPAIDLVAIDGSSRTRLVEGYKLNSGRDTAASRWQHRFLPDGRRVIYSRIDPETEAVSLWSVGLNGEGRKCIVPAPEHESAESFCIAPDGRHLAIVFAKEEPVEDGGPPSRSWELSIVDIDGTHRRPMPLPLLSFDLLDWRPAAPPEPK